MRRAACMQPVVKTGRSPLMLLWMTDRPLGAMRAAKVNAGGSRLDKRGVG
jgi:hypothetical protein